MIKRFFKFMFCASLYIFTLILASVSAGFTILFYTSGQDGMNQLLIGMLAFVFESLKVTLAFAYPYMRGRDQKIETGVKNALNVCLVLSIAASCYFFMASETNISPASKVIDMFYSNINILSFIPQRASAFLLNISLSIMIEVFIIKIPSWVVIFDYPVKDNFGFDFDQRSVFSKLMIIPKYFIHTKIDSLVNKTCKRDLLKNNYLEKFSSSQEKNSQAPEHEENSQALIEDKKILKLSSSQAEKKPQALNEEIIKKASSSQAEIEKKDVKIDTDGEHENKTASLSITALDCMRTTSKLKDLHEKPKAEKNINPQALNEENIKKSSSSQVINLISQALNEENKIDSQALKQKCNLEKKPQAEHENNKKSSSSQAEKNNKKCKNTKIGFHLLNEDIKIQRKSLGDFDAPKTSEELLKILKAFTDKNNCVTITNKDLMNEFNLSEWKFRQLKKDLINQRLISAKGNKTIIKGEL